MQKSFMIAVFLVAVIFVSACVQQGGASTGAISGPVSDNEVNDLGAGLQDLNTTSDILGVQDFDIEVSLT